MAKHGGGSIINTTSTAALKPGRGVMIYRAAKAGVVQFSKSLAIDLARTWNPRELHCAGADPDRYDVLRHGSGHPRLNQPLQRQGMPIDVANAALVSGERTVRAGHGNGIARRRGTSVGSPANPLKDTP